MSDICKLLFLTCLIVSMSAISCTQGLVSGCGTYNLASTNSSCPCNNCFGGMYLASNYSCLSCTSVTANCFICNSTTCSFCNSNAYLSVSKTCILCTVHDLNCYTCNNTNCTTCAGIYYINSSKLCVACTTITLRCDSCNSTSCLGCTYSYGLDLARNCVLCSSNLTLCSDCNNISACTYCVNNTYVVVSGNCKLCNSVLPGCKQCWCSSGSCCYTCFNSSYFFLSYKCHLCNTSLIGCSTCTSNITCSKCLDNSYALINGICLLCSVLIGPQCLKCISINMLTYCDQCASNQFILIQLPTEQFPSCQLCVSLMKSCVFCQSNTSCLQCSSGRPFKGGCSKVIGCQEVNSTLNQASNCMKCNSSTFFQTPVNNTCVCKEGQLMGEICGNIVGCNTAVLSSSGIITCISCSLNKGFIISSGICICKEYYYLYGSVCKEICGDGYLFVLACDDGNLVDGDGCSSSCSIQQSYICKRTSDFPATHCTYKGRITLSLDKIIQVPDSNSVKISFNFNPFVTSIANINFADPRFTNFTAAFCRLESYQISNEQLIFYVSFNASVNNQKATLFIQFDPTYILSPNFTMNFSLTPTNGGTLSFNPSLGESQTIKMVIKAITYASLGVFAVGSFAYRMIGVQTIQTLQVILLLIVNSDSQTYIFSQFSTLTISYGQFPQIPWLGSFQLIGQQNYDRLGYSQQPITKYLIPAGVQFILLIIYIILKICSQQAKNELNVQSQQVRCTKKQFSNIQSLNRNILNKPNKANGQFISRKERISVKSLQQSKQRLNVKQRIMNTIYHWFLFPVFLGFIFHFFNTLLVQEMFASSPNTFNLIVQIANSLMVIIAIGKYLIFANEIKILFIKKSPHNEDLLKDECSRFYIPFYILNQLFLFSAITTGVLSLHSFAFQASACIILIKLFYICFKRPYINQVNNFSILLNQLTLAFVVSWLLFQKYSYIIYQTEKILFECLIGLMAAVVFFGLTRAIFTIYILYFRQKNIEQMKQLKKLDKFPQKKIKRQRQLQRDIIKHKDTLPNIQLMKKEKIEKIKKNPFIILEQNDADKKEQQKFKTKDKAKMMIMQSRDEYRLKLIEK